MSERVPEVGEEVAMIDEDGDDSIFEVSEVGEYDESLESWRVKAGGEWVRVQWSDEDGMWEEV